MVVLEEKGKELQVALETRVRAGRVERVIRKERPLSQLPPSYEHVYSVMKNEGGCTAGRDSRSLLLLFYCRIDIARRCMKRCQ